MKTIAHMTGGALLMWALALGMLIYAAWRVVLALLPATPTPKHGSNASATRQRRHIRDVRSHCDRPCRSTPANPDGNAKVTSLSERIMVHSGGRIVIGVVGVITIGAGLYRLVKGVQSMSPTSSTCRALRSSACRGRRLGAIGEIGRGIGIG